MKPLLILKIYTALALFGAVVLSQPALSIVPVILLAWYLYQWRWPVSATVELLTRYFLFFALTALYSAFFAFYLAPLIALPTLVLVIERLEKTASKIHFQRGSRSRALTSISVTLISIALTVLLTALILSSPALVISAVLVLLGLGGLIYFLRRRFVFPPVQADPVPMRILAGQTESTALNLNLRSRYGGFLCFESAQDWVKVKTGLISIRGGSPRLEISVTPALAGPSAVFLTGYATDRWGLVRWRFDMEAVKLNIIPRARYAAWLAERYLSGSKPGALPVLSSLTSVIARHGLRQGIEYYGNRPYQPGDSMKNISWKHSSMHNKLISREFTEFRGRPAVILVNLAAGDAEGADRLAYHFLITALTLARENIPAALAAYDQEKVVLMTSLLIPQQLVMRSMQLMKRITLLSAPRRYLNPPDILRLRANTRRLSQSASPAAGMLAELLRLEYENLSRNVRENPCTHALSEANTRISGPVNVLVISSRNHDAEALAYNLFALTRKDYTVNNIM